MNNTWDAELIRKDLRVAIARMGEGRSLDIEDQQPLFGPGGQFDSIDLLELAVHVERTYGIKLRNDEAGQAALANIDSLVNVIFHHVRGESH